MATGAVREGVALTLMVAGLTVQMRSASSTAGGTGLEPWTRAVPTTYDALQALTGLDRAAVRGTLEVLTAAAVMRSTHDDAGLALTVDESMWAPHPLLAVAPWPLLSLALTRANAPLRAALVVFAELALDTELAWRARTPVGIVGETNDPSAASSPDAPNVWLELTLKDLARRVSYHLSHVENALAGLEDAGCLTRLRGTSGRALRIAPWTVGAAPPPDALLRPTATPGSMAPHDVPSPSAATEGVTVEFHGTRIVMAAGDTLDVSQRDANGRRVLRIRTDDGEVIIRPTKPR
jgi:hypothetical protein